MTASRSSVGRGDAWRMRLALIDVLANLVACWLMYGVALGWCPLFGGQVGVGYSGGAADRWFIVGSRWVVGVCDVSCIGFCIELLGVMD